MTARPSCCPEPRCAPLHVLRDSEAAADHPGESFVCFGDAPPVAFTYDGIEHRNDLRSCHYSPLKGLIAFQENAEDWEALRSGYGRALSVLRARSEP